MMCSAKAWRGRAAARGRALGVLVRVAALALSGSWIACSEGLVAGPQPDGTAVTPHGWRITPAGTQLDVGPGPLALGLHPSGRWLVALTGGLHDHSLLVVDAADGHVRQGFRAQGGDADAGWPWQQAHAQSFYVGLAFAPDGRSVYAADGAGNSVARFDVIDDELVEAQPIALASRREGVVAHPAGIAVSADGGRLFVAGNLADALFVVDPARGEQLAEISVGHLPYGVALNRSGRLAFVTNWGARTVSVVDLALRKQLATLETGTHPSAILASPTSDEIYVANTDSDRVSVLDGARALLLRQIDLRPYAGASLGSSPNALALSPNGATLYVANAGDNDVAVVALAPPGSAEGDRVAGLVPTAWYPSAVALDSAGETLFVTNMKGLGIGPATEGVYWPLLLHGTLSRIAVPSPSRLEIYTAQVFANNRFDAAPPVTAGSVIPSRPGESSPIEHVIYVLKENRTYDQVLGDLEVGNGDPSLTLFGESVTPNHHELSRRFVTFDNFYSDAEVSADGWSWSNGANANTYVQKNWPLNYAEFDRPYDFGGFVALGYVSDDAGLPGEEPGESFLWDSLARAGISYTNFGFYMGNPPVVDEVMPGLAGHTDLLYPGWDLSETDQVRISRWLDAFQGYQRAGAMPRMQFVCLPSDHTSGSMPGAPTPAAMVADNDLALGRLVEAVSHSEFWRSTVIFVMEDDAQDGQDHVDGHRSIALVISPYTQTASVDSTFYSTVSALRTMELLLGVEPMSKYDALATPMSAAFTRTPNLRPYTALPPAVSLDARNAANAPMARESLAIDFSKPDRIPMQLMNEILWKNVKGADREPPPTRHTAAVHPRLEDGRAVGAGSADEDR
jgi:DNA-binding beta-propeller fold protein YncE